MIRSLCIFVCGLLIGCAGERYPALPAGAPVLVLGDSVSYGTGVARGEDYPAMLAAHTGWHVVNAGVPGDTTSGALARLPQLLDEHVPRLVLVAIGGNDFLRQVPREQVSANLRAILAEIRRRDIPAVLLAMPRPNLLAAAVGRLSDDPLYREVAMASRVPLIEGVISEVLSRNALKSDPIHPNAEGYRKIAGDLAQALGKLGFIGQS